MIQRVGGRTFTEEFDVKGKKVPLELGGQWINSTGKTGPYQKHINKLIQEYKLELIPQYDEGKNVLELCSEKYIYQGNISTLTMFTNQDKNTQPELDKIWDHLNSLCFEIDLKEPQKHKNAKEFDQMSCQQWIDKNIKLQSTKNMVAWFMTVCLAANPNEVSFLFFLTWLRSSGGYENLVNIHGGAQEAYIKGGTQQIAKRMAKDIGSDKIILDSPVIKIKQNETRVIVTYCNNDKYQTIQGKYCVIAVPPNFAGRIIYSPSLPPLRDQLTQRSPGGCVVKIHILYENAFWKKNGYSGEIISDIGPISISYDKSHGDINGIVGFIAGSEARSWLIKDENERKILVLKQMEKTFGSKEAMNPLLYVEKDWSSEEFTRGCYFCSMSTGTMYECGKYLRKPIGRLHFAASETAIENSGYLDGALDSGIRASQEILSLLKKSKL